MTVKCSQFGVGAFRIFADIVSPKRLVIERKRRKFGPQGCVFSVYGVILTVKS